MSNHVSVFVGAVQGLLTDFDTLVTTRRQAIAAIVAQADVDAKKWVTPPGPRGQYVIPTCIREAWSRRDESEKELAAQAEKVAEAIYAAESAFSLSSLQALCDSDPVSPTAICQMRAAGDAVMRFASAAMRGHGFRSEKYRPLGRLLDLAGRLPAASPTVDTELTPMFDRARR